MRARTEEGQELARANILPGLVRLVDADDLEDKVGKGGAETGEPEDDEDPVLKANLFLMKDVI